MKDKLSKLYDEVLDIYFDEVEPAQRRINELIEEYNKHLEEVGEVDDTGINAMTDSIRSFYEHRI